MGQDLVSHLNFYVTKFSPSSLLDLSGEFSRYVTRSIAAEHEISKMDNFLTSEPFNFPRLRETRRDVLAPKRSSWRFITSDIRPVGGLSVCSYGCLSVRLSLSTVCM